MIDPIPIGEDDLQDTLPGAVTAGSRTDGLGHAGVRRITRDIGGIHKSILT